MAEPTINLTNEEKGIFSLLNEVVLERSPSTVVRVVGGWVRDKLLGVIPKDLDIMVDNMSGPDFARMVTSHLGLKDPHVIRDNPDRSKHVMTAKMYIPFNNRVIEIDVARCRKEVYNDKSRIPSGVVEATAEEDASRRDLTINAIFYNISSGAIEDFTGRGIRDLKDHILMAPGDPVTRFMEDPLRIFRTARFSARYGWDVDPATMQAMGDPEVIKNLYVKTAPERIGEEIRKMLAEPHADKGLEILHQHGIMDGIIRNALAGTEYEGRIDILDMNQRSPHHDLSVWAHSLAAVRNMMGRYPVSDPDRRVVALLTAMGHDLGKLFDGIQADKGGGHISYHGHEDHSREILKRFLKHVKLDDVAPEVSSIAGMHMKPYVLVDAGPKAIRKFLRQLSEAGVKWMDVINMAMSDVSAKLGMKDSTRRTMGELAVLRDRISSAEKDLAEMGVNHNKPLLNGGEIMAAFGNNRPGPWIGTVQEFVEDIVDSDPSTTKDVAVAKAIDQFPEFRKKQA